MRAEITSTDRQAANAALAALAAAGNGLALGQLWEINRGFVGQQVYRWYSRNQGTAQAHGLTLEDLTQEGFFAVQYAAEHYSPEKGSFTTYLGVSLQRQISGVIRGNHVRLITAEDGRQVQVSADVLNGCASLDTPLSDDDAAGDTLASLQPDPAAPAAFEAAEDTICNEELREVLEKAIDELPDQEAAAVRGVCLNGETLADVAAAEGVTTKQISQAKTKALHKLARDPNVRRWHDDIISVQAWRGTGWGAWNHSGSVEERAIEYLERKEEQRAEAKRAAQRARSLREEAQSE